MIVILMSERMNVGVSQGLYISLDGIMYSYARDNKT